MFPPPEALEPARYEARLLGGEAVQRAQTSDGALSAGTGDAIHHLRLYANYLTPRKGALSADLWRAVTTISRNLVLTWMVFGFLMFAATLVASAWFVRSEPLATRYVCSAPQVIADAAPSTLADSVCLGANNSLPALSHASVLAARLATALTPAIVGAAIMILLTGGWLTYGSVSPLPTIAGLVAFALFILRSSSPARAGGFCDWR